VLQNRVCSTFDFGRSKNDSAISISRKNGNPGSKLWVIKLRLIRCTVCFQMFSPANPKFQLANKYLEKTPIGTSRGALVPRLVL